MVTFKNLVEFDGFKIGNEFDSDVLTRAMGYDNTDAVAEVSFTSTSGLKVFIEFRSTGTQAIAVDTEDAEAQDIALKYMSQDDKDETTSEDFLRSFVSDFDNGNLVNESSLYMYKELNINELVQWYNNSWFEGYVTIRNASGDILFQDYESNMGSSGTYGSIEEIKTLSEELKVLEDNFIPASLSLNTACSGVIKYSDYPQNYIVK